MQRRTARLIQRHNSAAVWENNNPILLRGELGFELDEENNVITSRLKVGDGVTHWLNLPYISTNDSYEFYTAGPGLALDKFTNELSALLRYDVLYVLK